MVDLEFKKNGEVWYKNNTACMLYLIFFSSPSGVARALIGGGGGEGAYSYSRVLPDGFLLK